jgi:hypothetical protein
MVHNSNDAKPRPRRGPAWAYVLGGALGLPLVVAVSLATLHLQSMNLSVPPPGTLVLFGVMLGGKAYLIFSKPMRPRPERLSPGFERQSLRRRN